MEGEEREIKRRIGKKETNVNEQRPFVLSRSPGKVWSAYQIKALDDPVKGRAWQINGALHFGDWM